MGIYISGVKGLPEQVQANKEDIKTIKEDIAGIDFEAIRQLEAQVGENTQDINNLEASIGVQNQAINTLNNDVDALESKTQLMSYNDDLSKTDFRNSIDVADGVYATSLNVVGDGTIVNSNGSGLHFQEGAYDDTLTIANNDGAVQHFLHFNANGTLDIDGNPVGNTYYQHHITWAGGSNYGADIVFDIINTDPTPFTPTTFCAYLDAKGINSEATGLKMNNVVFSANTSEPLFLNLFYRHNNYTVRIRARKTDGNSTIYAIDSTGTFTDTIL